MSTTAIAEVKILLDRLPEDSHLEDIQYHLYVMEKIQRGLQRANDEGTLSQVDVEHKFSVWLANFDFNKLAENNHV